MKLQPWVACVLANFGGCACDGTTGYECLFGHVRHTVITYAKPVQPPERGGKSKKAQVSPLNTCHAANSRAGSEASHRDGQDGNNMARRNRAQEDEGVILFGDISGSESDEEDDNVDIVGRRLSTWTENA